MKSISLNGLALLICSCLWQAGLPAQLRKEPPEPPKLVGLPLSGDFIQVLEKVVQASEKKFEAIKGAAIVGTDQPHGQHSYRWQTNVRLPGSDKCYIEQTQSGTGEVSRLAYVCEMYVAAAAKTEVLDAVTAATQASLGPGYVLQSETKDTPGQTVISHRFCEAKNQTSEVCYDSRGAVHQYTFLRDPSRNVIEVAIREPKNPTVNPQEVGHAVGRVAPSLAPLPEARFMRRRADLAGLAANIIVNRTRYELKLEFDGPEHHNISIPPGGSRTITVPPGVYAITGRISDQGIVPFKGSHTYAGESEYRTEFYVQ